MNRPPISLPRGWVSHELPGVREHPARPTYSSFDPEKLPPISLPDGKPFAWLRPGKPKKWAIGGKDMKAIVDRLGILTERLGFPLPADFVTFMSDPALQRRVRSCTACYLLLPDEPAAVSGAEGTFLIHFLSDQQWCYHWHLLVDKGGDCGVVGSEEAFGIPEVPKPVDHDEIVEVDLQEDETAILCSPSFSEFLYRFRLENEIWFAIQKKKRPLDPVEQAYVDWYRRPTP